MRLGLAQINPTVGDLAGNVEKCLDAFEKAAGENADLIVFPEMAIPGYPPRDILFDPSFVEAVGEATLDLARQTSGGPPVLVGSLMPSGKIYPGHPGLHNIAALLENGDVQVAAVKQLLPGYDVFYEPRWFLPGPPSPPIEIAGKKIGVIICEDIWDEGYDIHPGQQLKSAGVEILLCLSASPYRRGILAERLHHARRQEMTALHLNLCGATDELIFDGQSFIVNPAGEVVTILKSFEEDVRVVDLFELKSTGLSEESPEDVYRALILGVRDFAEKNGLKRGVVGLSGGIDSAVTAVIAAEALGKENLTGVAIPSRYTDPRSTETAKDLADKLGIRFEIVSLDKMHRAAETSLEGIAGEGTAAENIQARLRMMVLMGYVNRDRGFLINTSNKSELALGYSTLYGDMAGAIGPLADLTKPEVYELARWINQTRKVIPEFTVARPPSAELKPDQVDPFDYDAISPAISAMVRENRSNAALQRSEHKRWQMGVVLKVSKKSFGTGRMIPITRR